MAGMAQLLQMMQDQQAKCGPLYDAIENDDFELAIKLGNSRDLRGFPLAQALREKVPTLEEVPSQFREPFAAAASSRCFSLEFFY